MIPPSYLFHSFYLKISLSENFATEPFKVLWIFKTTEGEQEWTHGWFIKKKELMQLLEIYQKMGEEYQKLFKKVEIKLYELTKEAYIS